MSGVSGISRFGKPKQLVCALTTAGTLPNHTPGSAYTGLFGVTGANGDITAELVSSTPPLPAGWTLAVNQATAQVTLAWPGAPVAQPADTLALLHFDGANGSTSFPDDTGRVWTRSGNTQVSTTNPRFGTGSAAFDGTGDWLSTATPSEHNFVTQNWTLEFWIRTPGGNFSVPFKWANNTTNASDGIRFYVLPSGQLELNGAQGGVVSDGLWHHVAVQSTATGYRWFFDGILRATTSSPFVNLGPVMEIARGLPSVSAPDFLGNIDEFRLSRGHRYPMTGSTGQQVFTPPTAPFTYTPPSSGTSTLPNLGFEEGEANWRLGSGWSVDSTGLVDTGTQSAKYKGLGQAGMVHAQKVPVTPGQEITYSARVSTGTTRDDFAGGEPGILWYDANQNPIGFSADNNDPRPRGPGFQTVSGGGVAPSDAAFASLFVSAFRDPRGRARDAVYVDNVSWNHEYAIPSPPGVDYNVVIRVRDGRGCQATLTQTIGQGIPLNTVSLLRFNGTNGSTTFTDETGKTWTRTGTPTITTALSRFDGAGGQFATGDRIDCTSTDFNFGTGDFTIECWVRITGQQAVFSFGPRLVYWAAAIPAYFDGITNRIIASDPGADANGWRHVALVRKSGIVSLYVQGQRIGTYSEPIAINPGAMRVGFYNASNGAASNYDEFRVVAGTAVYDGPTYTVPTARFPFP